MGSSAIIVGKSPATKQQNIFMLNKNKIFSSWGDIWVALGFNLEVYNNPKHRILYG